MDNTLARITTTKPHTFAIYVLTKPFGEWSLEAPSQIFGDIRILWCDKGMMLACSPNEEPPDVVVIEAIRVIVEG